MKSSHSEEQLSNLVFISMNRNLLKKMKVGYGADTFYKKMINGFAKKKQKSELIYK